MMAVMISAFFEGTVGRFTAGSVAIITSPAFSDLDEAEASGAVELELEAEYICDVQG